MLLQNNNNKFYIYIYGINKNDYLYITSENYSVSSVSISGWWCMLGCSNESCVIPLNQSCSSHIHVYKIKGPVLNTCRYICSCSVYVLTYKLKLLLNILTLVMWQWRIPPSPACITEAAALVAM